MAIKFNQQVWLKPYIDMNTELKKKKSKKGLWKRFFNLMMNAAFGKTMENDRKCKDIEFVATNARTNCLVIVSEPNYHTMNFF